MVGLTKEQRAAKAAQAEQAPAAQPQDAAPDAGAEKPANVLMTRDGVETEVANNDSVSIMAALGWQIAR